MAIYSQNLLNFVSANGSKSFCMINLLPVDNEPAIRDGLVYKPRFCCNKLNLS